MPSFGTISRRNLVTADVRLRAICERVIKHYDFSVICGYRNREAQNAAYHSGASMVRFPNSRHNVYPSAAIDIAPWPIDWNDQESFYFLAGRFMQVADDLGIDIRWGGDWDQDDDFHDQSFMDIGHFELGPAEEGIWPGVTVNHRVA
jgi:hypothetical protein